MKTQKINRVLKHFLLLGVFVFISITLNALNNTVENAPVTTATSVCNAEMGKQVTVPITVTGFLNIKAVSLTLIYDASKLRYVDFTKNPLLVGTCNVGDKDLLNGFHRLTLSWFTSLVAGVTLGNETSIVNYIFEFISGPATLEWVDMGPSCEFVDLNGILLDTPTANFYINGTISSSCLSSPTITPNGPTSFCEGGSVNFNASAGTAWKWSTGETTQSITVATDGSYTVEVTDAEGNKETSAASIVTVTPLPTVVSASVSPTSVIGSGQVTFSATASSGSIKWYDALTDGAEITVTNPNINTTTTYYAEAVSDGGCVSESRTAVTATVIPQGTNQLSYRFANPRIINGSFDSFEFDVQVKANSIGTTFRNGNVNLGFDPATLSTIATNWTVTAVSDYSTTVSISGSTLNIDLNAGAVGTVITNGYQTLVTVSAQITDENGVAGIDFNEANMNGQQFYKLSVSPGYAAYANPNLYDDADFVDTYVERVFCAEYLWTQVGVLNWNIAVNTSVWDGDATIPNDGNESMAKSIRIHELATLTIPTNGKLTVEENTEIKVSDALTIDSDGTGTGSLITGTASGIAVAKCYMTTDAWHIVSSPVSGQRISSFLALNDNVAQDVDDNSIRGMMDYNPEVNDWNAYFTNSTSGNLETGKGFCIRNDADGAVIFTGSLHAGNQAVSGLISEKWNCIGNPYTSAIGVNKLSSSPENFLVNNALNLDPNFGAIYIWDNPDGNNGIWGLYTIISNTPDPSTSGYDIQQGQAFMVKMNESANSVNFNSNMQMHNTSLPFKSSKGLWPSLKLNVSSSDQNSSTLIAFNSAMSKGLDPTYDAGLLKGGSDLSLYSYLVENNGIPFAIQALPDNDFNSLIIPIGIDSKTGGEVIFSSELFYLPSDCQIILEDKLTKTFTDLSINVYKTSVASNSSISDRFLIHTSDLTTGLETDLSNDKLSAYGIRNVEIRVNGNVSKQAVAKLYNIQGRAILVKNLEEGSLNLIKTPNIKTGVYLLFVKDNGKSQSFKIYIKE